ncbi:MAG: hypothetical protein EOO91_04710 [Pedobacter sp.]|nr:MAG: hypothetical protein EOO91_04710 [Pedobacter sp.]
MENQNQHTPKENVKPVSRKTNEEIDEDEAGNLIIGGESMDANQSTDLLDDDLGEQNRNSNQSGVED